MRNANWVRSVLALGAVLVVAGPGVVLAGSPGYTPKALQILGPGSVSKTGGTVDYNAKVTFTDNSTVTYTGTEATWSAVRGTISATGGYSAAAATGTADAITSTFTGNGVTITGRRVISLTP